MNKPMPTANEPWSDTRVTKTIWPPSPGTRMLRERHGAKLVCVRYRCSADGQHRYTTVELLVDHGPVRHKASPQPRYQVQLGSEEQQLMRQIADSGGRWDAGAQAWRVTHMIVRRLGLQHRARKL